METVELTIKDKILIAIHEESKKDNPCMNANITDKKFDIKYDDFKRILYELSRLDGYLDNAIIVGKYPEHLTIKNIDKMRLSDKGLNYINRGKRI